jgi:hypothetical protein
MNILYQIVTPASVYGERIAIMLGFINVALAFAVFFSCRTFLSLLSKLGVKNAVQRNPYKTFYKYHLYYWWFFGVSVLAHIIMGTVHTGLPQPGDPDVGIHWAILILGAASLILGITVFFSCRIIPRLFGPTIPEMNTGNRSYSFMYKYHSFYWIIFIGLVAAHFMVTFLHAGAWPAFH